MAYLVKCPICGKIKKVDSRVKYYFKCDSCQIAIEVKPNIIAKSFVMPKKDKESERESGKYKHSEPSIPKENLIKVEIETIPDDK